MHMDMLDLRGIVLRNSREKEVYCSIQLGLRDDLH